MTASVRSGCRVGITLGSVGKHAVAAYIQRTRRGKEDRHVEVDQAGSDGAHGAGQLDRGGQAPPRRRRSRLSAASSTRACWRAPRCRMDRPRSCASCRSTPTWSCCGARSQAAKWRRSSPRPRRCRGGGGPADRSLAREGRIWTLWSVGIVVTFGLPAALLVWIEPLALPVSAIFLGHGIAVLHLQARRGARGVKPIGEASGSGRSGSRWGCSATWWVTTRASCSTRRVWPCSAAGSARGWSGRRARSWFAPAVTASTASASGSARRTICRRATGWPTCCWRCARTRRASRPSRTGTSPARPGGCGWQLPERSRPALREARRLASPA